MFIFWAEMYSHPIVLKITIALKCVGSGNQLVTLFQKVHFRAKKKVGL